jgi:hypothetical protein
MFCAQISSVERCDGGERKAKRKDNAEARRNAEKEGGEGKRRRMAT